MRPHPNLGIESGIIVNRGASWGTLPVDGKKQKPGLLYEAEEQEKMKR